MENGVYVPPHELSDIIRRHSKTYREACIEFVLSNVKVGERFTLEQMTRSLERNGFDVRDLPWWRQGRELTRVRHFKKVETGIWLRVR